jgi:hypothetical protein
MQQVVVAAIVDVTPDLVDLLNGEPVVVVGPEALEELWDGVDENATHVLLIGERRNRRRVVPAPARTRRPGPPRAPGGRRAAGRRSAPLPAR